MSNTVIMESNELIKDSKKLKKIEIPILIRLSKSILRKETAPPFNFVRERTFKMIVSPEIIDLQGDLIQIEAIYKVLDIWINQRRGTIMDAHTNFPCGYATHWEPIVYETHKAALVEGVIFDTGYSNDDEVWDAIQTGNYRANSIGGKIVAGVRKCDKDHCYNYITDLELYEISMVPDGANQLADLLKQRNLKKQDQSLIYQTFVHLEKLLDELVKQDKHFLQVTKMANKKKKIEKTRTKNKKEKEYDSNPEPETGVPESGSEKEKEYDSNPEPEIGEPESGSEKEKEYDSNPEPETGVPDNNIDEKTKQSKEQECNDSNKSTSKMEDEDEDEDEDESEKKKSNKAEGDPHEQEEDIEPAENGRNEDEEDKKKKSINNFENQNDRVMVVDGYDPNPKELNNLSEAGQTISPLANEKMNLYEKHDPRKQPDHIFENQSNSLKQTEEIQPEFNIKTQQSLNSTATNPSTISTITVKSSDITKKTKTESKKKPIIKTNETDNCNCAKKQKEMEEKFARLETRVLDFNKKLIEKVETLITSNNSLVESLEKMKNDEKPKIVEKTENEIEPLSASPYFGFGADRPTMRKAVLEAIEPITNFGNLRASQNQLMDEQGNINQNYIDNLNRTHNPDQAWENIENMVKDLKARSTIQE